MCRHRFALVPLVLSLLLIPAALAFAGPLLLLHLVSPAAMGFGDVKAGIVLGYALGLVHWHLALAAAPHFAPLDEVRTTTGPPSARPTGGLR